MNVHCLVVGPFEVNCWIAWRDPASALVLDPGDDADRIAAYLAEHDLAPCAYLLTHGHVDHISALASLHRRFPAPVALHGSDLEWAFDPGNGMLPFYSPPEAPARVERVLADGQEWTDGGLTYRVLATPGHTPGSVSLHFRDEQALFTGDTLFAGSAGRTDLVGGNAADLRDSLARLSALPPATTIYPGHGPMTRLDHEKRTNDFLQKEFAA